MNEARRPPNITIHDNSNNDMYYTNNINKNNNNGMTFAKVNNKDDVYNNNDHNFIHVEEIVTNDYVSPRRSSLLPGEVRTPSFIVTMSDWAATTSASGNYTANHSVA